MVSQKGGDQALYQQNLLVGWPLLATTCTCMEALLFVGNCRPQQNFITERT